MRVERRHVFWLAAGFVATFVTGAGAGGVIGWWVGASTAPLIQVAAAPGGLPAIEPAAPAPGTDEADQLSDALSLTFSENLALMGRIADLEQLMDELEAARVPPRAVAAEVIARMEPEQLGRAVSAASGLTARELSRVDDLERYALRLIDVALEGIAPTDETDAEAPEGVVYFSTDRGDFDPGTDARNVFLTTDPRVYALFQSERGRVTVRWTRTDRPEVLLLERTTVSRRPHYGWVYIEPTSGWAPGEYRVTVYTGDEAIEPLASGTYTVADVGYATE